MEFFIPGLTIFLLAVVCAVIFAPKATPMVAAILSLLFLTYGVYDHYRMFLPEYRLSTWQQTFSTYSPYLMIGVIILYVIFSMIAFFTGGTVPVPSLPNVEIPEMPTITNTTNQLSKSLNTAVNSISDSANDLMESTVNTGNSLLNKLNNSFNNSLNNSLNNNKRNGNLSRSALETL
jgi:predicted PurR-regulated permease PerM